VSEKELVRKRKENRLLKVLALFKYPGLRNSNAL
jgi:hypothetical protein